VTEPRAGTRLAHVGLLGNVAVGLIMSASVFWLLEVVGRGITPESGASTWLPAGLALVLAFVTARALTSEADKVTLRRAVCKAASAPAAHPDTVRAMERAPLSVLTSLVDDLVLRRVGHR
jgi:hypothetical protein